MNNQSSPRFWWHVGTLAGLLLLLILAGCAAPNPPSFALMPVRPGMLSTFAEKDAIHIRWEAVRGAASYTLFWSNSPAVARTRGNRIEAIKDTTYYHSGLTTGKTYYYFLIALNKNGKQIRSYSHRGDIPYDYPVRRNENFMTVVPRIYDTFNSLAALHLNKPYSGWEIKEFNGVSKVTPFEALVVPLKPIVRGGLTPRGYRLVPILTYHFLSLTRSNNMTVQLTEFERQMSYLKRNSYQVITLEQMVKFLEHKGGVPRKAVVITFDDGWRTTYDFALPILKKYGFPATLFVYTDLINSHKSALTWEQVRKLAQSGVVDIQCHTKSHRNLNMKPKENLKGYLAALETELVKSRETIKQKIGKECEFLAYPYGATNHLVAAMAQKTGYRAAFTVRRGSNPFFSDNFRVRRSMIFGKHTLNDFKQNLFSYSNKVLN